MSDIVERARIKSGMLKMGERIAFGSDTELIDEMADEIERLRKERSELLEALEGLVSHVEGDDAWDADKVREFSAAMNFARTIIAKAKGTA